MKKIALTFVTLSFLQGAGDEDKNSCAKRSGKHELISSRLIFFLIILTFHITNTNLYCMAADSKNWKEQILSKDIEYKKKKSHQ